MDGSLNSHLALYIAMKSLGVDRVSGLYIQSRFDSPKLKAQVQKFTEELGIKLYSWKLENELVHDFISQAEHLVGDDWKKRLMIVLKLQFLSPLLICWDLGQSVV